MPPSKRRTHCELHREPGSASTTPTTRSHGGWRSHTRKPTRRCRNTLPSRDKVAQSGDTKLVSPKVTTGARRHPGPALRHSVRRSRSARNRRATAPSGWASSSDLALTALDRPAGRGRPKYACSSTPSARIAFASTIRIGSTPSRKSTSTKLSQTGKVDYVPLRNLIDHEVRRVDLADQSQR